MARIRTVKPEFWSSPDTAAVDDPWARLLFIAMWNWADDMGRGTANPKELAGFAFPNDESITAADIRRMLGGIRRGFGVTFYKIGGRTYYAIPSWNRHQKVDHRSGPKYPAPEDGEEWDPELDPPPEQHKQNGSRVITEASADPAEITPNSRGVLGAGTGEQGNRGKNQNTPPRSAPGHDRFEEFYAAYPRHIDRKDAEKAWSKAVQAHPPDEIIDATKRYAATCRGKEPKFIKYPATWLNKGGYLDEPEPLGLRLVVGEDGVRRDPKTGRVVESWG